MFSTLLFSLFAALLTLSAAFPGDLSSLSARHHRLAQRVAAEPHRMSKRRQPPPNSCPPTSHGTDATEGAGLIQVTSPECGPSGATKETTSTSGPNGSIYWLNCGITGKGGWNPPPVKVDQLITHNLTVVMTTPDNIFKPCAPYVQLFEKHGKENGIPPILMASFAMKESSCNPDAIGQGGEQGLMQISKDKCDGKTDEECRDPDYNIGTATAFFNDLLKSNDGNVVRSVGMYNGWFPGMTHENATHAATSSCCHCQQDLTYLWKLFDIYLLGKDSDTLTPPKEFDNLAVCVTV